MKTVCFLCFLFLSAAAFPQQNKPAALKEKAAALRVFLDKQHYSPLTWNDAASGRLYNHWLDLLDDDKMFFTKADLDILESFKTKLDDELAGKGWGFFDKSLQLYKKAVKQADSLQKIIYSRPLDFSKPDQLHYPFAGNAASLADQQQRLVKLTKWQILRSMAVQLDSTRNSANDLSKIPADFATREIKARERIRQQHETSMRSSFDFDAAFDTEMGDKYLQAIAWCYDPHTTYMNLGDKKDFETELSGFEYSTGMDLTEDEDGNYKVEQLEPGGSAWRTGELHTGDIVMSIKKGNGPDRQLSEMDEDEVAELLRGSSDEKVEVTIKTAAGTTKKVVLSKEKVTDDEGIVKSYVVHGKSNIGYIQLPGFYSRESQDIQGNDDIKFDGCANDVSKEIIKLTRDTIAGLVLDLRYNGGGSMWEAMQLAGIFIDYGPVASVKDRTGKIQFLKDPNRGTVYDGPLLVMINGSSASASEMTSAVLQDYSRALIVGSTTYGKGTAQAILPMDTSYSETSKKDYASYKDFVKVTEEKFYRIDGTTTQWKGVVPDIRLPDIYEGLKIGESSKLSALLPDNSKKSTYQPFPALPLEKLQTASAKRVAADTSFMNISRIAGWFKEMDAGRDIPLQWQPYIALYRKNLAMYQAVEKSEGGNAKKIMVSNNNFDKEKIKFTPQSGKELNDAYLKRIAADNYIIEACRIMEDWLSK